VLTVTAAEKTAARPGARRSGGTAAAALAASPGLHHDVPGPAATVIVLVGD
jgi:hypothetical protein